MTQRSGQILFNSNELSVNNAHYSLKNFERVISTSMNWTAHIYISFISILQKTQKFQNFFLIIYYLILKRTETILRQCPFKLKISINLNVIMLFLKNNPITIYVKYILIR